MFDSIHACSIVTVHVYVIVRVHGCITLVAQACVIMAYAFIIASIIAGIIVVVINICIVVIIHIPRHKITRCLAQDAEAEVPGAKLPSKGLGFGGAKHPKKAKIIYPMDK